MRLSHDWHDAPDTALFDLRPCLNPVTRWFHRSIRQFPESCRSDARNESLKQCILVRCASRLQAFIDCELKTVLLSITAAHLGVVISPFLSISFSKDPVKLMSHGGLRAQRRRFAYYRRRLLYKRVLCDQSCHSTPLLLSYSKVSRPQACRNNKLVRTVLRCYPQRKILVRDWKDARQVWYAL